MSLIMHGGPKTVESCSPKNHNHDHQNKTKLRLIDTVVAMSELQTYPVVKWARDCFPDNAQDEWRHRDQAGLTDREIVRWLSEENTVDDRKDTG